MRMKVHGRLMQARFIEIHQVFAKRNKVGYFSNRVNRSDVRNNHVDVYFMPDEEVVTNCPHKVEWIPSKT